MGGGKKNQTRESRREIHKERKMVAAERGNGRILRFKSSGGESERIQSPQKHSDQGSIRGSAREEKGP